MRIRQKGMGVIYKLTSPSGKGYVGKTVRPLADRLASHKCMSQHSCRALKNAIEKYGWSSFRVEVLAEAPAQERRAEAMRAGWLKRKGLVA